MIEFAEYVSNPNTPSVLVNKVVGIYRVQPTLIKCTFGLEALTASGMMRTVEAVSLIWTDAQAWMEAGDAFRFAIAEVSKGTFQTAVADDGGGRRTRHQ